MLDPARIVVSTTFENRPPYTAEAEILYRTLDSYGGELAKARRIACSVGAPDPFVVDVLADLDVEVREVAPFDERSPHSNKLAMLELAGDGDLVLALDTDIAVAGDPTPWLGLDSVQAKVVDDDPLELTRWPLLFETLGIDMPTTRYLGDYGGRVTIPYFNSGVLAVPSAMCADLHREWGEVIRWLLDHYDELPKAFTDVSFFTDQVALALALARLGLPTRALPLELNFPTHTQLHPASGVDRCEPVLVHHHHRLQRDGQLLVCPYAVPNQSIERINEELRREPDEHVRDGQAPFDNEAFWNERYRTNPTLGSGIGSRGELAVRKLELLQSIVDELQPASILDVGCGDLEIVSRLRYDGDYTGIDIADVVVQRNRAAHPDWTFLHGDFVTLAREHELAADLVICMDVLIHQHDADYYRRFVEALVAATRRTGVVAAYDRQPDAANASEITAWHGPISDTLASAGARDVATIDEYRATAVMRYGT